jgi:hypothetical protein
LTIKRPTSPVDEERFDKRMNSAKAMRKIPAMSCLNCEYGLGDFFILTLF